MVDIDVQHFVQKLAQAKGTYSNTKGLSRASGWAISLCEIFKQKLCSNEGVKQLMRLSGTSFSLIYFSRSTLLFGVDPRSTGRRRYVMSVATGPRSIGRPSASFPMVDTQWNPQTWGVRG